MINFRYHLVSLIAVFAALAVGVVLGAGPLQTRIARVGASDAGSTISQSTVEELSRRLEAERVGVEALATQQIAGRLDQYRVGLILLPGANADDITLTREALEAAGASVVNVAQLGDNWHSEAMSTYRQTLATSIETHLSDTVPADATADGIIAAAIYTSLTSQDPNAVLLDEILTDEQTPLMTHVESGTELPTSFVIIGPHASDDAPPLALSAWAGLASTFTRAPQGVVVVGDASTSATPLAQLRQMGTPATTVDAVGTQISTVATILALAQSPSTTSHYGVEDGARSVLPPQTGATQ